MREYCIHAESDGKRLDRWLHKELPLLSMGMTQKYLRLKRIKVNGKPAKGDTRLQNGDVIQLYIEDSFFEKPKAVDPFLSKIHPKLTIVYEDDNILIVDKQPGLVAHPDQNEKIHTLLTYVQAYLYQKGEYDSKAEGAFSPVLCNRIDRFTGGIVLIAKNEASMKILNDKIRNHELGKYYLAIIHGRMHPPMGTLHGYIVHNTKRVTVSPKPVPGAQEAVTHYKTLETRGKLSLIECALQTGRTHQIRAQFSAAKHPLLGDSQYGDANKNVHYTRSYQALYAYRLAFEFTTDAKILNYLKGKSFHVREVPFVQEYFGDNVSAP